MEALLATATKDRDVEVRRSAIASLGTAFPNSRVLESLTRMDAFTDPRKPEHTAIIRALGLMGELGLPSLIKLLDHPNAATRAAAVAYIGVIWENSGDNAAPRAILRSLKDSNSGVKLSAIRALPLPRGTRYEGDQIVVESLIKMIMDNEREVRIAAIQALTHIGDPRAIAPLIALLDDHDKSVRINARFALTDFGEAAMAQLIAAIKSEDKTLRGNAMDALAAFHNEPAVWTLAEFAVHGDTAEVRQMAVATLKRKGAFAINILTPKLNAPDANVRETAKQALAKIKLQK